MFFKEFRLLAALRILIGSDHTDANSGIEDNSKDNYVFMDDSGKAMIFFGVL